VGLWNFIQQFQGLTMVLSKPLLPLSMESELRLDDMEMEVDVGFIFEASSLPTKGKQGSKNCPTHDIIWKNHLEHKDKGYFVKSMPMKYLKQK